MDGTDGGTGLEVGKRRNEIRQKFGEIDALKWRIKIFHRHNVNNI